MMDDEVMLTGEDPPVRGAGDRSGAVMPTIEFAPPAPCLNLNQPRTWTERSAACC